MMAEKDSLQDCMEARYVEWALLQPYTTYPVGKPGEFLGIGTTP